MILENELEELNFEILRMSGLIEEAIYASTKSLLDDRVELAQKVILEDDDIDKLYIEVQDKCLRLLALCQPLATDLRTVQADLQIATDLERMGDCAEKIAKSTLRIHNKRTVSELTCLSQLVEKVRDMVTKIIDSYNLADIDTAGTIAKVEEEIDNFYRKCFDNLIELIKKDASKIEMAVQLLFVGHYLERIADHATNIGESVLYMVTGQRIDLNK